MAIGVVVDDAIVVIEAVHAKMEEEHLSPLEATKKAMHEISGAIIAITFLMAAVFIPVAFMSRSCGYLLPAVLYHHGNSHHTFGCGGVNAYARALCHDTEEQSWQTQKENTGENVPRWL